MVLLSGAALRDVYGPGRHLVTIQGVPGHSTVTIRPHRVSSNFRKTSLHPLEKDFRALFESGPLKFDDSPPSPVYQRPCSDLTCIDTHAGNMTWRPCEMNIQSLHAERDAARYNTEHGLSIHLLMIWETMCIMVLTLDGNPAHVAEVCDCCWSNQMYLTDQIYRFPLTRKHLYLSYHQI